MISTIKNVADSADHHRDLCAALRTTGKRTSLAADASILVPHAFLSAPAAEPHPDFPAALFEPHFDESDEEGISSFTLPSEHVGTGSGAVPDDLDRSR